MGILVTKGPLIVRGLKMIQEGTLDHCLWTIYHMRKGLHIPDTRMIDGQQQLRGTNPCDYSMEYMEHSTELG